MGSRHPVLDFKIKICGITNEADAEAAVTLGADAIGLNFFVRSLRCVSLEKAQVIIGTLPESMARIGVFVNEPVAAINRVSRQLGLTAVQLHGDERTEDVSQIEFPVIRALRVHNTNRSQIQLEITRWQVQGVAAILLDSGGGQKFGGTGVPLDWTLINGIEAKLPLILAGGLNCDNVAQAIQTAQPNGVDVASGIEKFPGAKDHLLLKRFVKSAKAAFNALNSSEGGIDFR